MSILEQHHRADLDSIGLNKLVSLQPFNSDEQRDQVPSRLILWYRTEPEVLQMAREMFEVQDSSLILSYWEDEATSVASWVLSERPVAVTLSHVCSEVWDPCLQSFHQLGRRIANSSVTFEELDRTLKRAGDEGSGDQIQKELVLLERILVDHKDLTAGWADQRLQQIQQYRQLHDASESANVILKMRERLRLAGDFQKIHCLTQLVREWLHNILTMTNKPVYILVDSILAIIKTHLLLFLLVYNENIFYSIIM